MKNLYDEDDKKVMQAAFTAQNKSRLQELITFSHTMNFKKIGVANCLSMQKYADVLVQILQQAGFEVVAMNCKQSGLKHCDVLGSDASAGPSCDPASQAEFLNSEQTDFNINVGLCLGHGYIFDRKSAAPSTTFIVKDFATNHDPKAELI
jgi:uncharacterized metal-binding protein